MSEESTFTPLSPAELHDLRRKILNNEDVTPEEIGAAVRTLAADRYNNGKRGSTTKTKKKAPPPPSLDDLL